MRHTRREGNRGGGLHVAHMLLLATVMFGGWGCGGTDDELITLPPLAPPVNLVVNGSYDLAVDLNQGPSQEVEVVLEGDAALAHAVGFFLDKQSCTDAQQPCTLRFAPGEQRKLVRVTGLASTSGRNATITLTLKRASGDQIQLWRVKVDDSAL